MSKKLSKIDKPSAAEYASGRKLYCVPLLFYGKDSPEDYSNLYVQYWSQVVEQIERLEKTGKIDKIYYESVFLSGQDGLERIKQQNEGGYDLVRLKMDQGASLMALENNQLFSEYLDWGLCLSLVRSIGVREKIQKFYLEAEKKRDEYIVKRIDETLKESEVGLLIMNDDKRIKVQPVLQADIHVFLVHPPALNDISRWMRDRIAKNRQENQPSS